MLLGIALAFIQSICWAGTTIALRKLSTRLDAFCVSGVRAAFGLLIVLPLVLFSGHLADYATLAPLTILYLAGSVAIGGVLGDSLYVTSLRDIGIHRAFPITNSYPIFTMLFAVLLLGEQITLWMILGMILVLVGVYFVARPRHEVTAPEEPPLPRAKLMRGVLLSLGTSVIWGLTTVILSLGLQGVNSAVANSIRVPVVVILSLIAAQRRGHLGELRRLSRSTFWLLVLAGITGWGLGGTLYAAAIQLAGPSKTAVIGATSPLFAVPLSMIFLSERPTRDTLVGTILSIIGVALVIM